MGERNGTYTDTHTESVVDGRTRHYGDFYGVDDRADRSDDRPLLIVWGNCQAEAMRILLASDAETQFRTVRIPPVHELESADLPHVHRLLRTASILLTQPVRAGYRSLPLGVPDLAEVLPPNATVLKWPVLRYAGLHPFQVIVRHPSAPAAVPDTVPYHDLRTILAVHHGLSADDEWDVPVSPDGLRNAAAASLAELRRREARDADVSAADLFVDAGVDATHTINHPTNQVLEGLARRILNELNAQGTVQAPGRALLGAVRAPVESRVLRALGLAGDARADWTVDGTSYSPDFVHRMHMDWYLRHPGFVDAALTRHAALISILGLPL